MKKRTVIVLIVCVVLLIFPIVLNIQDLVWFFKSVKSFSDADRIDQLWKSQYYSGTYLQYAITIWIEFFVLISIFLSLLLIIIVNLSPKMRDKLTVKVKEFRDNNKIRKIEKTEKKLKKLLDDEGKPE